MNVCYADGLVDSLQSVRALGAGELLFTDGEEHSFKRATPTKAASYTWPTGRCERRTPVNPADAVGATLSGRLRIHDGVPDTAIRGSGRQPRAVQRGAVPWMVKSHCGTKPARR